jgi:hypothetical protein
MQPGEGLTAVRFDGAGLTAAVGTANGLVALFDLRSSRPALVKDHMYGAAIRDIKFHAGDGLAGARCCIAPPHLSWLRWAFALMQRHGLRTQQAFHPHPVSSPEMTAACNSLGGVRCMSHCVCVAYSTFRRRHSPACRRHQRHLLLRGMQHGTC